MIRLRLAGMALSLESHRLPASQIGAFDGIAGASIIRYARRQLADDRIRLNFVLIDGGQKLRALPLSIILPMMVRDNAAIIVHHDIHFECLYRRDPGFGRAC